MKNKIREFVCKTTFSDPKKITDGTLLFDEGIFDSMGLLDLISFLEENYSVKVADSELEAANFGSIDAIASFLERKLKIGKFICWIDGFSNSGKSLSEAESESMQSWMLTVFTIAGQIIADYTLNPAWA